MRLLLNLWLLWGLQKTKQLHVFVKLVNSDKLVSSANSVLKTERMRMINE